MSDIVMTEEMMQARPFPVRDFQTHVPDAPKVWRVKEVEIEGLSWLADRFRKTGYPDLSVNGLVSWMRAAINDRNSILARSNGVVGLYQSEQTALEPAPVVRECWIRMCVEWMAADEYDAMPADMRARHPQSVACVNELTDVRNYALSWAKQIHAKRFIFDTNSDTHSDDRTALKRTLVEGYVKKRVLVIDL